MCVFMFVCVCVCACACGGGEQFFSRQLLFGRFDNDEPVMASLYPAFKEYLDYYNGVIKVLAYMGPALHPTLPLHGSCLAPYTSLTWVLPCIKPFTLNPQA
jgi:hypothetical protein